MRGIDEPWLAAEVLPAEFGRAWAREWPGWFGPERVPVPRAEERAALARVTTPLGDLVAKRERARGWKRSLVRLRARTSRSARTFRLALALRARGLATPEPLCVLGPPGDQVLVTRYVEGCGPWERMTELGAVEPMLTRLADALAHLHAAGFRHSDLQAANLLCCRGAGEELHWTDLDSLRYVGTLDPRQRARDLARLGASFESPDARAAGIRAGHWPALIERYLVATLGRAPQREELEPLLARTRAGSARAVRRHLASGRAVH